MDYNSEQRELQNHQNQEQRDLNNFQQKERNELFAKQRTMPNDEYFKLQRELQEKQNNDRKLQQERHQFERKALDAKYGKNAKSKGLLGAVLALILAALVPVYNFVNPDFKEECFRFEAPDVATWPFGICVLKPKKQTSTKFIVFNPGTLGKHSFLSGNVGGENHEALLNHLKENTPTIVSWTLYPSKIEALDNTIDEEKSGAFTLYTENRLDYIQNIVMPRIRTMIGPPKDIILMGTSRGGWNALQLYRRNKDLFSKIILVSPMIITCDPFDITLNPLKTAIAIATQQWMMLAMAGENKCMKNLEHPGKEMNHILVGEMFKSYYNPQKDKTAYPKANPFTWDYNNSWPKTLILSTPDDEFPFYDANYSFHIMLTQKDANSTFVQTTGKHGAFDVKAIEDFINL